MPFRFFSPDEAAQYLSLRRSDLDRLVKDREIPFEVRGDRTVFRVQDLDAWASRRILSADPDDLAEYHRRSASRACASARQGVLLADLISVEQIDAAMQAKTKPSILRDIVDLASIRGWVCDPAELIESLEQREALSSTAVEGGLAFLHPRAQEPYRFEKSFIVLGRTIQPIHFGAPHGQPTDLFFLLCSQDDKLHLHVLARLCLIAQETDFLTQARAAENAAAIYESLLEAEREVLIDLQPEIAEAH